MATIRGHPGLDPLAVRSPLCPRLLNNIVLKGNPEFYGLPQNACRYGQPQANHLGVRSIMPPASSDRLFAMAPAWDPAKAGVKIQQIWGMTKQFNRAL